MLTPGTSCALSESIVRSAISARLREGTKIVTLRAGPGGDVEGGIELASSLISDPVQPAPEPRGAVDHNFWRDRRVLLTGHTGFKGAWLALWLQALGARVTGFSVNGVSQPSLFELARVGEGVESIEGDVCDAEAIAAAVRAAAPEVVIHLAAQSLVRRSFAEPVETFQTNVIGTVNVLDAVRRHGDEARAVVNVTSDKCYENREWEWGYREDEPMGGHDPYSSSKGCAELVTAAYRRSFFSGARLASARAGNVIGGGDWGQDRLLPDIMRAVLVGEEVRVRNPGSVRPWQHVLNPLSGYLVLAQALWDSPEHASGWNFGPVDEDARTVGWIVERIAELWPGELRSSFDEGPHPHEARYLKVDSSRARTGLGWRPPVELEVALEATVAWYQQLHEGADMRAVTLAQIDQLASSTTHA
jgi:CDP-glucose 4,6-dehydratase